MSEPEALTEAAEPAGEPGNRNKLGAGEGLCELCHERRTFARSRCRRCVAAERRALGLTCSYVGPSGEACLRGIESRGFCGSHVRALRASGVLQPLRADGGAGRLPAKLPGQYAVEKRHARATPLNRFLRHGVVPPAVRHHVENVGTALVEALGGRDNVTAQELLLLENVLILDAKKALALREAEQHGFFSVNDEGVRTIGASAALALKAIAEQRQLLNVLGLKRRAKRVDTLDEWAKSRAAGEAPDAIPAEVVDVEPASEAE